MKNQILLDCDPYYIVSRIKEVDENYFIVYNRNRNTFELHNSSQKDNSYALTIPYDTLDERTIFLARKTRKENFDKLIKEMDEDNQKLQNSKIKDAVEQIKEVII